MPFLRIALVICTLLPACFVTGQQQRDSVLNRTISVHADDLPVTVILDRISADYGIFFSYDALLINNEQRISVNLDNKSVQDVLREMFRDVNFHFLGKNNHIIISDREDSVPIHPADSVKTPPFITLTGRVQDQSDREPLGDVTVSLSQRPVGTITNADGNFILKLPPENRDDTLLVSIVGYGRQKFIVRDFGKDQVINLQPVPVKIREIKVRAVSVAEVLNSFRENISVNYPSGSQLLTGFYRETTKQEENYINISEAVVQILKAPYGGIARNDQVILLKARKSPEVQPFHWVNFKLQGGPRTIIMLDVVKSLESFLDPEYANYYRYTIHQVIWYKGHPVFVIRFKPVKDINIPCFEGELYIDKESYALLSARFGLDDKGLEMTGHSFIIRKPKGFRVKPLYINYQIDFAEYEGKWYLHTARTSIAFRVRSPKDNVNSAFYSVSDLLITDVGNTNLKRFPVKDLFTVNDIFAEFTVDYDDTFWEDYNIIKPDEDLENAIKKIGPATKTDNQH
jgi:hypothetical protein